MNRAAHAAPSLRTDPLPASQRQIGAGDLLACRDERLAVARVRDRLALALERRATTCSTARLRIAANDEPGAAVPLPGIAVRADREARAVG